MIKPGDRVEWNGVNKHHQGIVTESSNGELYVSLGDGHRFPLPFLLEADSFKVISQGAEKPGVIPAG